MTEIKKARNGHGQDNFDRKAIQSDKNNAQWPQISPEQLEVRLNTNLSNGLSEKRVQELRKRYGRNILTKKKDLGLLGIFLKQFKNPLVFLLLITGIITVALQEYLNATVIFVSMLINVAIGTFQEGKSSDAFEKLKKSQQKFASVIRDGKRKIVQMEELVIGDLVILEPGMSIPADIRIINGNDLHMNESVLTGEWFSVEKNAVTLDKNVFIYEQSNMVWMGTLVTSGQGLGVVVEIGNNTQLGLISESLTKDSEGETTIQKKIRKLAVFLTYLVIFFVSLIFLLGLLRHMPIAEMFLITIALAVGVIPEGLPTAITVVFSVGVGKILRKGGLIRNLLATETLGSTTIILTDKTGTLTQAKMRLAELITFDFLLSPDSENSNASKKKLLEMAILSSDAFVEEDGKLIVHGRPIEKALITEGLSRGISQRELEPENKRADFFAFNSENRFAVSLNQSPNSARNRMYLSGAPDFLLGLSSLVYVNGNAEFFTDEMRKKLIERQTKLSNEGMRFLGIAYEDISSDAIPRTDGIVDREKLDNVVFAGLIAFDDPPRTDVKKAIHEVKNAGARVVMITGDNPETALKVARYVGITGSKGEAVLGQELDKFNDDELLNHLKKYNVFARVLPSQKLRISEVLKRSGEIVAMTGDGINDAPALRNADIGIAVGSGTEVAKEASDIILLNDSFSIIVEAIKEGRKIISNVKKVVSHTLSTGFAEVFLVGGSLILGMPLPILAAQILWVDIIEDSLLNFAFAFEPVEKDIMKRGPRGQESKLILTQGMKKLIFSVGIITGLSTLILYVLLSKFTNISIEELRTTMFTILTLDSILAAFSFKNFNKPIWKIQIFSNKFLVAAALTSFSLLLIALNFGPIKTLLQLAPLTHFNFLIMVCVALFNLLTIETAKYLLFGRKSSK